MTSEQNGAKAKSKKSTVVCLRLREDEMAMLQDLISRERQTGSNASEFFRTLLHREFNRSKTGKSYVPQVAYSDMRQGRPATKHDRIPVAAVPAVPAAA